MRYRTAIQFAAEEHKYTLYYLLCSELFDTPHLLFDSRRFRPINFRLAYLQIANFILSHPRIYFSCRFLSRTHFVDAGAETFSSRLRIDEAAASRRGAVIRRDDTATMLTGLLMLRRRKSLTISAMI